jgi:predicted HAD superfamily Cof-like phosphohydrolase
MKDEQTSMNAMQRQVTEFHRVINAPVGQHPQWSRPELRAELILEEAMEAAAAQLMIARGGDPVSVRFTLQQMALRLAGNAAISAGNAPDLFVFAIDGLCDSLYVQFGTFVEMGINATPYFNEVHRSNMTKIGGEIRPDGKNLKPASYEPPNLSAIVDQDIQRTLGEAMTRAVT